MCPLETSEHLTRGRQRFTEKKNLKKADPLMQNYSLYWNALQQFDNALKHDEQADRDVVALAWIRLREVEYWTSRHTVAERALAVLDMRRCVVTSLA